MKEINLFLTFILAVSNNNKNIAVDIEMMQYSSRESAHYFIKCQIKWRTVYNFLFQLIVNESTLCASVN